MQLLAKSFYLKLYLFWFTWVSLRTLFIAFILSLVTALIVYISKGFAPLNEETFSALKEVFYFTFPIFASLSFIIALLLVFKALFSKNIEGKKIKLYDCEDEHIPEPLLSDVTMLWRKWLFVTVWAILIFLVLFIGVWKLASGDFPPISWFNAQSLYVLISFLGGIVFVFGINTCKKIRISDV